VGKTSEDYELLNKELSRRNSSIDECIEAAFRAAKYPSWLWDSCKSWAWKARFAPSRSTLDVQSQMEEIRERFVVAKIEGTSEKEPETIQQHMNLCGETLSSLFSRSKDFIRKLFKIHDDLYPLDPLLQKLIAFFQALVVNLSSTLYVHYLLICLCIGRNTWYA
jgi:hypothetical protein